MTVDTPLVVSSYLDVRDGLRHHDLKQALYDAGGAVMADSLITLHGDEHKQRRRVENRLFRRGTFRYWELNLVPGIIDRSFVGPLSDGKADLVTLGRRTIMFLTALVAGIDPPTDDTGVDALDHAAHIFSGGATVVHSTRDLAEVDAEVAEAMRDFDERFLTPSKRRREQLLRAFESGEITEDDLPKDVLTALLRNWAELDVDRDIALREVAFYLQAGSHSTANLFTHVAHLVFASREDPAFAARLENLSFIQRCVHEALRLHPASPVAWRRALTDITLRGGSHLPEGSLVELDLQSANCDPSVWGNDAALFRPDREIPDGVAPWGHSFGGGMHACIGMELDGGVPGTEGHGAEHAPIFGTVTLMVDALLKHGARPDPDQPAERDTNSQRENFARYPVVFGVAPRA